MPSDETDATGERTCDTQRRSTARTRRSVFVAMTIAVLALVTGLGVAVATAPLPVTAATVNDIPVIRGQAVPIGWPAWGSGALGTLESPEILETHGPQNPVPMASITKLITALIVLERYPLAVGEQGPTLGYTEADVALYNEEVAKNGSVVPVHGGLQLTERQTLEAILIASANNYATSLSKWAFGSVDAYLERARAWLTEHNFTQTTIVDASGLVPANVSTPSELVELGRIALSNPVIAGIVATTAADLPGVGGIANTNDLLGRGGVHGVKTGTTDEAGSCLLFSSPFTIGSQTVTIVGVLLGGATGEDLDSAVSSVLDSSTRAFQSIQVVRAGEPFGTYTTPWGETAQLVSAEDAFALTWQDRAMEIAFSADPIKNAPSGEKLGSLAFSALGFEKARTVALLLDRTVAPPSFLWRFTRPFSGI